MKMSKHQKQVLEALGVGEDSVICSNLQPNPDLTKFSFEYTTGDGFTKATVSLEDSGWVCDWCSDEQPEANSGYDAGDGHIGLWRFCTTYCRDEFRASHAESYPDDE